MAKVKLNPIVEQVRGQVGDLVFRNLRGDTILSSKPGPSTAEPTPEQNAHRERFRQAVAYGQMIMENGDTTLEDYQEAANRKNKPVFALMVADFMNVPSIDEVDLSEYTGQLGAPIYIRTHDDFRVEEVQVSLSNGSGTQLENGSASSDDTGRWVYNGQTTVTAGTSVRIEVTVTDQPGGKTTNQQTKTL